VTLKYYIIIILLLITSSTGRSFGPDLFIFGALT
jgi:hypothetical protein